MEKNGKLILSREELKQLRSGILPNRVKETWSLTLAEAKDLIMAGYYEIASAPTAEK